MRKPGHGLMPAGGVVVVNHGGGKVVVRSVEDVAKQIPELSSVAAAIPEGAVGRVGPDEYAAPGTYKRQGMAFGHVINPASLAPTSRPVRRPTEVLEGSDRVIAAARHAGMGLDEVIAALHAACDRTLVEMAGDEPDVASPYRERGARLRDALLARVARDA